MAEDARQYLRRDHVLLQAISRVNRPYEDASGQQKPSGLIVDFIGMLRDVKKALAFDSQDVSGVIEDLDLLLDQFRALIGEAKARYLQPRKGSKDKQLEALLYEDFVSEDTRQEFIERYREIESLYEILSPSPELRDHIDTFRRLAEIYAMIRNAYSSPTRFYGELAHKTEHMVREAVASYGPIVAGKQVEFDLHTLKSLQADGDNDNQTIINFVRAIETEADEKAAELPVLVDIAQRAQMVLTALEQRTLNTELAMAQIELLVKEREEADAERDKLGLDARTFSIYWQLRRENLKDPLGIASEIIKVGERFPNYIDNEDERRQLKAAIYAALLREVSGATMVRLGEVILRAIGAGQ